MDPYLTRVNRALKDLGCAVAIEVAPSGKRLRLRSTLPLPDGSWKQQRINTPIFYPAGLEQARKLAEELGRDIELHRMGLDPFPFDRWFDEPKKGVGGRSGAAAGHGSSGLEAIRRTEQWWSQQRRRGVSASVSWATDYASPLKPLLSLEQIDLKVLKALVESREVGSRNRRRASIAVAECIWWLGKLLPHGGRVGAAACPGWRHQHHGGQQGGGGEVGDT